ncbi:hypothetical protein MF672_030810 [Actinomadura sp. ATCC 31491]|uniref:Uncharacterized protein n=1 Tax=Actinomadura luzonensis TaxID=2805427 RepID=A0ABT0G168_9ACTN|nr:hypothetical protein [Actinomadura luzonensis]MCK2218148.1 hypothetical protein [Actinomadura luzonensis]
MTTRMLADAVAALPQVLEALGWEGWRVVQARALSSRRWVVCELDEAEHEARLRDRLPPAADALLLRCLAHSHPGFLSRPAPVRIQGAIAARRTWVAARNNLGGFVSFGERVALMPTVVARGLPAAVDAACYGFGVVALEEPGRLVHPPEPVPAQERTWVRRLVEEVVYDAVLRQAGQSLPVALGVG